MGWGSKSAAAPQPAETAASKPRGYIEALAAKPVTKHAMKSKIDTTEIEREPEPEPEPEREPEPFSEAKKGELAWQKLRSQKGWTQETQAMLLYEFIAHRGLFADLIKFTGRR